jgi:hypothetical protein
MHLCSAHLASRLEAAGTEGSGGVGEDQSAGNGRWCCRRGAARLPPLPGRLLRAGRRQQGRKKAGGELASARGQALSSCEGAGRLEWGRCCRSGGGPQWWLLAGAGGGARRPVAFRLGGKGRLSDDGSHGTDRNVMISALLGFVPSWAANFGVVLGHVYTT